MMESFNRVKEFVVTLMIRCAASLLAVYYTCKRTTHIKSNRLSSLSLFDFLYLMSLYMFCVCVCTADQRLFFFPLSFVAGELYDNNNKKIWGSSILGIKTHTGMVCETVATTHKANKTQAVDSRSVCVHKRICWREREPESKHF